MSEVQKLKKKSCSALSLPGRMTTSDIFAWRYKNVREWDCVWNFESSSMPMNNLPFTPRSFLCSATVDTVARACENNDFKILMKWMLNFLRSGLYKDDTSLKYFYLLIRPGNSFIMPLILPS